MSEIRQYTIPFEHFLDKFDWQITGTLTPPFVMSKYSVLRAMERLDKKLKNLEMPYRIFWVAEPFSSSGYHVHYIAWFMGNESYLSTNTKKINLVEFYWQQAIGASRKTNNKSTKFNKFDKSNKNKKSQGIRYMLKGISGGRVEYDFYGNAWSRKDML